MTHLYWIRHQKVIADQNSADAQQPTLNCPNPRFILIFAIIFIFQTLIHLYM
ncbi:unnamed protein product [Meloidogyne enterolobii]|uniref:Uncharacterized protein n=1 Tax=Meloidogyne enterolobii TaxID=390850 RepID=A0ACB1ATS6_MELEN